jgi:hypothetical protein
LAISVSADMLLNGSFKASAQRQLDSKGVFAWACLTHSGSTTKS